MAGEEKWNILIMKHNVDATTALHQEMDSEMANNRLKKMMGVLKAMLSSTREGTHHKTKHTLASVDTTEAVTCSACTDNPGSSDQHTCLY